MSQIEFNDEKSYLDSKPKNFLQKKDAQKKRSQKILLLLIVSLGLFLFSLYHLYSGKTEIKDGGSGPSLEELRAYNIMQR